MRFCQERSGLEGIKNYKYLGNGKLFYLIRFLEWKMRLWFSWTLDTKLKSLVFYFIDTEKKIKVFWTEIDNFKTWVSLGNTTDKSWIGHGETSWEADIDFLREESKEKWDLGAVFGSLYNSVLWTCHFASRVSVIQRKVKEIGRNKL